MSYDLCDLPPGYAPERVWDKYCVMNGTLPGYVNLHLSITVIPERSRLTPHDYYEISETSDLSLVGAGVLRICRFDSNC